MFPAGISFTRNDFSVNNKYVEYIISVRTIVLRFIFNSNDSLILVLLQGSSAMEPLVLEFVNGLSYQPTEINLQRNVRWSAFMQGAPESLVKHE